MKKTRAHPLPAPVADIAGELSPRQQQVLELVASGYERRQIEKELHLQSRRISTHLSKLYEKMGVCSLQGLQAKLGILRKIPLPDGRFRLGAEPIRRKH